MKPKLFKTPYDSTYYTVVTSEKMYRKLLKKHDLEYLQPEGVACVATQSFKDSLISVVCMFNHDADADFRVGVLVHESVHVWQDFRDHIGESNPSAEFEAYTIQEIFLNILSEYSRQTADISVSSKDI